ncbi:Nuclear AAA ATPase (VCP subfamily) [Phaffia rhodozyma]|uniref:Nuclear AAA ATPase (VCP subfamily) n=1 Tax=Phaffia rhodozyma TaxID=264483 RepID=A0A0F7SQN9_PHARH|nr:Nuclear AAA ATPase (VCP subfamily) [Phaffia rhodozyma]
MANSLNRSLISSWSSQQSAPAPSSSSRKSKLNLNALPSPNTTSSTNPLESHSGPPTPASESGPSSSTASKRRTRPTSTSSPNPAGSATKRVKTTPSSTPANREPPTARLAAIGGLTGTIEKLLELVALPLLHPELYQATGVQPPRGVLLYGPPGCGKTMIANAIAGELGMPFISISAPSVVSGMSGESEKTLRETFEEAQKIAPCLLFIDEIDAITPKRETAQREMERRIVAQLLTCMDDLAWHKDPEKKPVIVIGATNRPDSLDPALRRAGRFDCEIGMGVPDEAGREEILRTLLAPLSIPTDFDIRALAKATPGYVGADLASLTSAAGVGAVKRMFRELGTADLTAHNSPRAALEELLPSVGEDGPAGTALEGSIEEDATMENGDAPDESGIVPPVALSSLLTSSTPNSPPSTQLVLPTSSLSSSSTELFQNLSSSLLSAPITQFLKHHTSALPPSLLSTLRILPSDFKSALQTTQPSSQREGFATIPNVTWADIGALHSTRDELHMAIVQPIRRPELFKRVGIEAPGGVLMWGPPGCGKTLLAKAVASESRANFLSVKGPEVLNKYVGESERAVRQIFARARASAPCIIFFDELDALVPRRDDSMSESSARVVNTLLTELDGLDSRKGIYVIGATNRPDMIDPAMVRPGRLDKLLYIDLPTPTERAEILRTMTKKTPLSPAAEAALEPLATSSACDGFSGADLAALVREAATLALRGKLEQAGAFEVDDGVLTFEGKHADQDPLTRSLDGGASGEEEETIWVEPEHFVRAAEKVTPSVSIAQRKKYQALRNKFSGLPVKGKREPELEAGRPVEAGSSSGDAVADGGKEGGSNEEMN